MTTVKELIEELKKHDPEMRVATWRVEDYGDSGELEFLGFSLEEVYGVYEGEDPEEGETPGKVLILASNQAPEEEGSAIRRAV